MWMRRVSTYVDISLGRKLQTREYVTSLKNASTVVKWLGLQSPCSAAHQNQKVAVSN